LEDSYRVVDNLPGAPPPSRSFLTILTRRKWIIIQITAAFFLLALVIALLQPRSYEASVWMLLTSPSRNSEKSAVTTQADAWSQLQNDLSMHIRLIRRREMAEAVAKDIKLDKPASSLLGNLSVAKVSGTTANLISLSYKGAEPALAQKVVNSWARAYQEDSLTRSAGSTIGAIQYVQEQIVTVEKQLRGIEQQIARIEQENLTSGIGAGGGGAAENLTNLLSALSGASVEKAALRAQIARTKNQYVQEPKHVQETEEQPTLATQTAQDQLAQLSVKLEKMRTDYFEDSPEITTLKEQIARIEKQLARQSGLTQTLVKTADNPSRVKIKDQLIALQGQLNSLEAREKTLRQQIDTQRGVAMTVPPTNIQYTELRRKVGALEAVHGALLSRLYELQLQKAMAVPAVQLVKAAELPTSPVQPPMRTIVGLGLLVGLLLSIVIAVIVDQMDDTFANLTEIDESVQQRLIGAMPRYEDRTEVGLAILEHPRGAFANAVRKLASTVRIELDRSHVHSLMVTSTGRSEGKSITSANLAVALAKSGMSVLLVDCDLHKPVQHKLFGTSNDVGLSNVLVGGASAAEVQQLTQVENLLLIPSGPLPPSPVDILASEAGEKAMREIGSLADIVIWDTPPAAILADATVLGAVTDRTLFVVGHKAKRGMMKETLRNLQDVGIKLLGIAANQVRPAGGSYYYYYYYPYAQDGKKAS
jgi:polysaccharide biosynthesis transport protein